MGKMTEADKVINHLCFLYFSMFASWWDQIEINQFGPIERKRYIRTRVERFVRQYGHLVPWRMIKKFLLSRIPPELQESLKRAVRDCFDRRIRLFNAPDVHVTRNNALCVTDAGQHGNSIHIAGITTMNFTDKILIGLYTLDRNETRSWSSEEFEGAGSYIHLITSAIMFPCNGPLVVGIDQENLIYKIKNRPFDRFHHIDSMNDKELLFFLHRSLMEETIVENYFHHRSNSVNFFEHSMCNALVTFQHYMEESCAMNILSFIQSGYLQKKDLSNAISHLTMQGYSYECENGCKLYIHLHNRENFPVVFKAFTQLDYANQRQRRNHQLRFEVNPNEIYVPAGFGVCLQIIPDFMERENVNLTVRSWNAAQNINNSHEIWSQGMRESRNSRATRETTRTLLVPLNYGSVHREN